MTQRTRSSRIDARASGDHSAAETDALLTLHATQREVAEQLAEETAALRREAAELLSRSRWWREECRRELLRCRRWYGAASAQEPDH
jgi:hypothetical protein